MRSQLAVTSGSIGNKYDKANREDFEEKLCRKFLQIKSSATSRSLDFNLSITSISNLLKAEKCYFTGVELTWEPDKPNSLTVDRVNNSLGYVKGNVVACCLEFNKIKANLTVEQITLLYRGVQKNARKARKAKKL